MNLESIYEKIKYDNIICEVTVYVGDTLIDGKRIIMDIIIIISQIKNKFYLNDLGNVDFIIGIKFIKCEDGYIIY